MIELAYMEALQMVLGVVTGFLVMATPAIIWLGLHSLDKWVQSRRELDLDV